MVRHIFVHDGHIIKPATVGCIKLVAVAPNSNDLAWAFFLKSYVQHIHSLTIALGNSINFSFCVATVGKFHIKITWFV